MSRHCSSSCSCLFFSFLCFLFLVLFYRHLFSSFLRCSSHFVLLVVIRRVLCTFVYVVPWCAVVGVFVGRSERAWLQTKQEVLADLQHRGGDKTRVSEQRPRRRRLKDASAGAIAWRAKRGADSRKWQPREKRTRPQRQTASISREQEHASNDARSQDAEQGEESDARYLLSLTFAARARS